ncbi:MAG: hypothetical protein AAFQ36_00490 [Pseudomonadota bacterium]
MLLKTVSLFLIFIVVLAMFGKLRTAARWVGLTKRKPLNEPEKPTKCPKCGAFRVGTGDCPCGSPRS